MLAGPTPPWTWTPGILGVCEETENRPRVQHRSLRCERYSGVRWGPERWPPLLGGYFLSFAFSGLVTGRGGGCCPLTSFDDKPRS